MYIYIYYLSGIMSKQNVQIHHIDLLLYGLHRPKRRLGPLHIKINLKFTRHRPTL